MHKQVDHVIVGRAARFALLACLLAAALSTAPTRADESPDPAPPGEVPPAAASSDSSGIEIPGVAPVVPDSVAAFSVSPNPSPGALTRKVRLKESDHNVARSGPGERYAIVGVYKKKATFPIIAKSGDWYNVRLSETETGWFHSSLCQEFDDNSDLEFRPNPKLYTRTGSFILTAYGGAYAFDRKSNSLVLGGRLGYYLFDRLQADGSVSWTRIQRPAEIVESLFDLTLEAEDFNMLSYQLGLTFEILPGRQMVPFISGGLGSSIMQGETEPSFNIGAGTLLYFSKRAAMRWEFRDYVFDSGPDDARQSNNNIEFSIGTSILF